MMMLKKIAIGALGLALGALQCSPAFAYAHANAYGGSTSHSYDSTSHTNAYGGHTSGSYGNGATHTNTYGGTTSGKYGSGATHSNVYGGTTSGQYGNGATHTNTYGGTTSATYNSAYHTGGYYGYPPPPPVYAAGCYNCYSSCAGCIAGAAVAGAAVAYSIGERTATVPATGCAAQVVSGVTYTVCGTTWFQPAYGANGLYYTVVTAP
ncbi:MAG TPA: hypothetical protein VKF82_04050 [Candidatus Eremiobacteraceae bacterium]|nr:hypothetical protein [Candidatus Eremiobacteraceae bacterium]